jgi:hypothetical protein
MADLIASPPKIESGKTLDLRRRRGAFPYLLADRRGRPGVRLSGSVAVELVVGLRFGLLAGDDPTQAGLM